MLRACRAGLPEGFAGLLTTREDVGEMLGLDADIDLLIPRGSGAFVRYIMDNSRIPVLGHSDGICHLYIDAACDAQMAARVVVDAKTQYPAACNAVETLLAHRDARDALLAAAAALRDAGVRLKGDARAQALLVPEGIACEAANEEDWKTEYLDNVLSIRVVDSLEEAIAHINPLWIPSYGWHPHGRRRGRGLLCRAGGFRGGIPKLLHALCGRLPLRLWRGGGHFHRQDSCAGAGGHRGTVFL